MNCTGMCTCTCRCTLLITTLNVHVSSNYLECEPSGLNSVYLHSLDYFLYVCLWLFVILGATPVCRSWSFCPRFNTPFIPLLQHDSHVLQCNIPPAPPAAAAASCTPTTPSPPTPPAPSPTDDTGHGTPALTLPGGDRDALRDYCCHARVKTTSSIAAASRRRSRGRDAAVPDFQCKCRSYHEREESTADGAASVHHNMLPVCTR